MPGIFICNMYDPRREDFFDVFLKNVKDDEKKKKLENIFREYLSRVEIGDPKPTKKLSKEQLLSRKIVGIYATDKTSLQIFNLLTSNLETNKKRKKSESKIEEVDNVDYYDYVDDDVNDLNIDIDYTL